MTMMLKRRPRRSRSQLLLEASDLTDQADILVRQLGNVVGELGSLLRAITDEQRGGHSIE